MFRDSLKWLVLAPKPLSGEMKYFYMRTCPIWAKSCESSFSE